MDVVIDAAASGLQHPVSRLPIPDNPVPLPSLGPATLCAMSGDVNQWGDGTTMSESSRPRLWLPDYDYDDDDEDGESNNFDWLVIWRRA